MIYINGESVAPVLIEQPVNLLEGLTIESGKYSYSYGNVPSKTAESGTYRFANAISLTIGKVYEIRYPLGINLGVQMLDEDGKSRFNSQWMSNGSYYFVATLPSMLIGFVLTSNIDPYDYSGVIELIETDYKAELVPVDFDITKWEHYGLSYSSGRSFADAKTMNTQTNRFRYNYLINVGEGIMWFENHTGYNIAFQQYDADELGRVDSGWISTYRMFPQYNPNIAICGDSSASLTDIVDRMQTFLKLYKITR